MIPVTKPYMPDIERYMSYVNRCFENRWVTNNGPLVNELTERLEEYLGVENLLLVANGTLALQIAYKTLGVKGKAITTPFTFVATSSSLVWEGIEPVYADIDRETFNLDPQLAEKRVDERTSAIVPVHVYANPCDVVEFSRISEENGLKLIYDAAHCFSVKYKGDSILNYGDAATLSFHGTKIFHTGEGGGIVFRRKEDLEKARRLINFGFSKGVSYGHGINAKMSELHAAMGLACLDEIDEIMEERKRIYSTYQNALSSRFRMQRFLNDAENNHAYYPILFQDEQSLLDKVEDLKRFDIFPRRYFYPSLNGILVGCYSPCPISEDISTRILCLPIYPHLKDGEQKMIIDALLGV